MTGALSHSCYWTHGRSGRQYACEDCWLTMLLRCDSFPGESARWLRRRASLSALCLLGLFVRCCTFWHRCSSCMSPHGWHLLTAYHDSKAAEHRSDRQSVRSLVTGGKAAATCTSPSTPTTMRSRCRCLRSRRRERPGHASWTPISRRRRTLTLRERQA